VSKPDPYALIAEMGVAARAATRVLAAASPTCKAGALRAAAASLRRQADLILAANAADMADAAHLSAAMRDRLRLDPERLESIAAGIEAVAALPDPVGQVIDATERPNGLCLSRVRVPIGVIGIVYESRPNVTADAAALCVMAGNAAVLRGGSEATATNRAVHAAFVQGLMAAGLPADAVQLVANQDRHRIAIWWGRCCAPRMCSTW
jgi:glutamate-5-semialdehyde dehydrogenase